ncbi:DUF590-domain-containing protein [Coprinopsis marcescibilis]|uniref:DUF590-domain-containing protein n=1 Tax=Coprinopsis marcescibilis TaxID=230819 RepID=A0A5C3KX95_COPMA|nr:DUF590-domain-containing protein [Coprinopsis marcescibilis]
MFSPNVDLVIDFRVGKSPSKQQTREEARKAERQYNRLIETLTKAGLNAVGRRGESLGHILVFVCCPVQLLDNLIKRERRSDFLSGLPFTPVASGSSVQPLSPADRIRIVHSYIASTSSDGGLGISPDTPEWDLVESIFPLQDRQFNEVWVKAWKPSNMASIHLEKIRQQFGDAVAIYFSFLSSYTSFLIVPAILGAVAHYFLPPYSPIYSIIVALWATIFVEWWRVHERILSLKFGTRNSFRVEKRRAQYKPGIAWWNRELRILLTLPVILAFGAALFAIVTGIFVFEAFITHLYQGPGQRLIGFSPTIVFIILVPRFLAIYHALAVRLTKWENHAHQSTYTFSLTLKIFALGALVAYSGLALSAFVYVPFGEGVMHMVQRVLFDSSGSGSGFKAFIKNALNGTAAAVGMDNGAITNGTLKAAVPGLKGGLWDMDVMNARKKLNPARLRDQMFAFTVTNQVINTFNEIGLPYVLRAVNSFMKKGNGKNNGDTLKKKVVFEDEKEKGGLEERAYLERVRSEAMLPEYDLFADYNEMVVQFGYVALWSTIWPLAGVMALINNIFELRSDAFKISVHHRRPIPVRTDTIGPWLDALTFLTWLSAITNSALVYLFSPSLVSSVTKTALLNTTNIDEKTAADNETVLAAVSEHLVAAAGGGGIDSSATGLKAWGIDGSANSATIGATKELLIKAALVALVASHAYILVRALTRHIVEKVYWKGSQEVVEKEHEEKVMKERFLKGVGVTLEDEDDGPLGKKISTKDERRVPEEFWDHDEGVEEIQRIAKEV